MYVILQEPLDVNLLCENTLDKLWFSVRHRCRVDNLLSHIQTRYVGDILVPWRRGCLALPQRFVSLRTGFHFWLDPQLAFLRICSRNPAPPLWTFAADGRAALGTCPLLERHLRCSSNIMAAAHRLHGPLLASGRGYVDCSVRLDLKFHKIATPMAASSDALLPG